MFFGLKETFYSLVCKNTVSMDICPKVVRLTFHSVVRMYTPKCNVIVFQYYEILNSFLDNTLLMLTIVRRSTHFCCCCLLKIFGAGLMSQ